MTARQPNKIRKTVLLVVIALATTGISWVRSKIVFADNRDLSTRHAVLFFHDRPYNGWVIQPGSISWLVLPYKEGLLDGTRLEFNNHGHLLSVRPYHHGRKIGVHRGWFPDGARRFRYEFADGKYNGDFWEWHPNGRVYRYRKFDHGHEIGQKIWRKEGKIHANYVNFEGKLYGLKGGTLCQTNESNRL